MPSSRRAAGPLDVYLLPSVIGGGLGDVAEVHSAGRWLAGAGFRVWVFRRPGHTWSRGMPGPFRWPPEVPRPVGSGPRALTVSSQFGVTCAPARSEPLGRAGEWAREVAELEDLYGTENVLHLSLEEFARTLTSAQQVDEREREGGVPSRHRARGRGSRRHVAGAREAHELYRKFRAFGRPNLLTLFPTFVPVAAFTREFPEAIQIGPIWPYGAGPSPRKSRRDRTLLWVREPLDIVPSRTGGPGRPRGYRSWRAPPPAGSS